MFKIPNGQAMRKKPTFECVSHENKIVKCCAGLFSVLVFSEGTISRIIIFKYCNEISVSAVT